MEFLGRDILTLIGGCVIFVVIFTTGVYLQIKVILVVKRDQTMAWEINLAHSVVMVVIFSSVLILKTMSYFQITFYDVFGKWLCYLLLSLMIFGFLEMLFHSLYISLYKYQPLLRFSLIGGYHYQMNSRALHFGKILKAPAQGAPLNAVCHSKP